MFVILQDITIIYCRILCLKLLYIYMMYIIEKYSHQQPIFTISCLRLQRSVLGGFATKVLKGGSWRGYHGT